MAMTNIPLDLPADYWQNLSVSKQDIEFLQNYLFETETPLTGQEMADVLVSERLRQEHETVAKDQKNSGKVYLPLEKYEVGDRLVFPALNWKRGKVTAVRAGQNPAVEEFDVIAVAMDDSSELLFAANLDKHKLNSPPEIEESDDLKPDVVSSAFGDDIAAKIESALEEDDNLVRIAGRWFPRALLIDINVGHLNLAEAVLDVSGGEPMLTSELAEQLDLVSGVNPRLAEFSLNYAMQSDKRFDEVGPAGQVLWVLERHEPQDVRTVPAYLSYSQTEYDRTSLTEQMLELEAELDDELITVTADIPDLDEVTICLNYPHWRAGTLPISSRLRGFFPTAYESPRVRFSLRDVNADEQIPAWVVRNHGYVYGLREWFEKNNIIPGGYITLSKSDVPGEVYIAAQTRRSVRDWVRTVLAGSDGGLVFAILKQEVACEYNERMVIAVPDVDTVDLAWAQASKSRQSLEQVVVTNVRELSKLTPQGHVHAQELYSAVNILRRCSPGRLFSILSTSKKFHHVGDLYYRLADSSEEN